MTTFHTIKDLRQWVEDALGSEGSDVLRDAVADKIRRYGRSHPCGFPNWGDDFGPWLEKNLTASRFAHFCAESADEIEVRP